MNDCKMPPEYKELLSNSQSKNEFIAHYNKLCSNDIAAAKSLNFVLLTGIKAAIEEESFLSFECYIILLLYANELEKHDDLLSFYQDDAYPLKGTNMIILACKHNRMDVLKHILSNFSTLTNIVLLNFKQILPEDQDDLGHTAFYYAISSNDEEILKMLIDEWPEKYFTSNPNKLEKILSRTYEETKVRNISLSYRLQIFIEENLLQYRFRTDDSKKDLLNYEFSLENVKERYKTLSENISSLHLCDKVNDKFIFTAKFAVQNLFILKQQLKCTYNVLPWEEIEFCLISYILMHTKRAEIHFFYKIILTRSKILNYLSAFYRKLEKWLEVDLKNVDFNILNKLPEVNRDDNVSKIIAESPEFKELYSDYQDLRDVLSLETINNYIQLTSAANFSDKLGPTIMLRCITMIGEHLKNTLESPKLSSILSETLLLSLPKKTRYVYSTSHSVEAKVTSDINYFTQIKNDTKRMSNITNYLLYKIKTEKIKYLLEKFVASVDIDELREISMLFHEFKHEDLKVDTVNVIVYKTIKKIIEELKSNITDRNTDQDCILSEIDKKLILEEKNIIKLANKFFTTPIILGELYSNFWECSLDSNEIKLSKHYAANILKSFNVATESSNFFQKIAQIAVALLRSCLAKVKCPNFDEVDRLTCLLINLAKIQMGSNTWVKEIQIELNKASLIIEEKEEPYIEPDNAQTMKLSLKILQLRSCFNANLLIESIKTNAKKNEELIQKALEMMVLDILSIVNTTEDQSIDNVFLIDEYSPILYGNYLLNYLSNCDLITDILPLNPTISVLINSKYMISEEFRSKKNKFGKVFKEDIPALKRRFAEGLLILSKQEKMFCALREGNEYLFQACLAQGADINGRDRQSQTSLHVAAKACNLDIVKFLLNHCLNVVHVNIDRQSPLHVAAECCRASVLELLLLDNRIPIDGKDNQGRTALHYAAKSGDIESINILLKHKANARLKDNEGYTPLHYAIRSNKMDAFRVFVQHDKDTEDNVTAMEFTPLHSAASKGCVDIMNVILSKLKTDVNAKTKRQCTALHLAAVKGHLEAVKTLISKGGDPNAKDISGCVALHYAVEHGYVEIVKVLLAAAAHIDVRNKDSTTALHIAVKAGCNAIVDVLLEYKADVLLADIHGNTPIHYAIQNGNLSILQALLKNDPSVLLKHENFLVRALENNQMEIAEYLIKKGHCVNSRGQERHGPLYLAAENYRRKEILQLLLKYKADVGARDYKGATALHSAVESNELEIVKILIENEADVNAMSFEYVTPLHLAAARGHLDIFNELIANGAHVENSNDAVIATPLHWAVEKGHVDVVAVLLDKISNIDVRDVFERTALYIAIVHNHEKIIELLIKKGADVNALDKFKVAPLTVAIKKNQKNVVNTLIDNGADLDIQNSQALYWAVIYGNKNLVDLLLQRNVKVNFSYGEKALSLLHVAVTKNFLNIASALIEHGHDVDCGDGEGNTPLHAAIESGNEAIVRLLLENDANVNVLNDETVAPLHMCIAEDHQEILLMLLNAKPNLWNRNRGKCTPLEHAIIMGRVEMARLIVSYMLPQDGNCLEQFGYRGQAPLHLAAQTADLPMVQMLDELGAKLNSTDRTGHMAIHLAATNKGKNVVEYLINRCNADVEAKGPRGKTPLHFAAMSGQVEVAEFLLSKGASVNAVDWSGVHPIHLAALYGHLEMAKFLMHKGARSEMFDNLGRKLVDVCTGKLLRSKTETLFEIIRQKNVDAVKKHLVDGVTVNEKDANGITPLILAVNMYNDEIVALLLKHQADPNIADGEGLMPLHYAVIYSDPKIVKILLANGAMYNPTIRETGRTPLDLASENSGVVTLLKTIDVCFTCINKDNAKFIGELRKIKSVDTIQAIIGAINREKRTLLGHAWITGFTMLDRLFGLWDDPSARGLIDKAEHLFEKGRFSDAMNVYAKVFVIRKNVLGLKHPTTLDMQYRIGICLHNLKRFGEAAEILEKTYLEQKRVLSPYAKASLKTKNALAMALFKQKKILAACDALEEIVKSPDVPEKCQSEVLLAHYCMALILEEEQKYEQAIDLLADVLEKQRDLHGSKHMTTLSTESKYLELMKKRGKAAEALKRYKQLYHKSKETLGLLNDDTTQASDDLFQLLLKEKRYDEAMEVLEERFECERKTLGEAHRKTRYTKEGMSLVYIGLGAYQESLRLYRECREAVAQEKGRDHQDVQHYDLLIDNLTNRLRLTGDSDHIGNSFLASMKNAISKDDLDAAKTTLEQQSEVNKIDSESRTLLHFAVDRGQLDMVRLLLDNGAQVYPSCERGNNPLHIAVLKGFVEIVEVLLDRAKSLQAQRMNAWLNAGTRNRGNTALHIAAKNGRYDIVKLLLRYSAIYNVRNDDDETPTTLAREPKILNLLRLIATSFCDAKKGNEGIIAAIEAAEPEDIAAVVNTRNREDKTVVQVAIMNKHAKLAAKLLKIIQGNASDKEKVDK